MAGETADFACRLELPPAPIEDGAVKAWRDPVLLRSYLPEPPDRNPMFLETRLYQGSSGRVYPLPFVDRIAEQSIAPGKKQWTWGNNDFGYAWDPSLTDEHGPYIELMAGAYTDFSFLEPGETINFSQYWYPLQQIGPPKAASLKVALNVAVSEGSIPIGVQVAQEVRNAKVRLLIYKTVAHTWTQDILIRTPLLVEHSLPNAVSENEVELRVEQGTEILLCYAPGEISAAPAPAIAQEPPPPAEISSNDQLFLTGRHLAQYRHATRRPELYWQEAIRRDDGDARSNTALGRWHMNCGEFAAAEVRLRKAIERLSFLNPNPADGEGFYLLGLVLRFLDRPKESYDAFAKAAWNAAWKGPASFALAQANATARRWSAAYDNIQQSLVCDVENLNARNLASLLLNKLQRNDESDDMLQSTRSLDPLDHWSRYLSLNEIPADNQALLDLVWDYAACGLLDISVDLLRSANMSVADGTVPLILYTLGYLLHRLGETVQGDEAWKSAAESSPGYCFPHRLEDMQVLQSAIEGALSDPRAAYSLGNLLYDRKRHEKAFSLWERAAALDPSFPTVHRNLGIALFNVRADEKAALAEFARALEADPRDGRILYERNQLWKRVGVEPQKRLTELLSRADLVAMRDDLSVEVATLYNQTGRPDVALQALLARKFQPWEGGEGLVLAQFTRASLLLAKQAIRRGSASDAIAHLQAALDPPSSLGEAPHMLANKSDIEYWLGVAYAAAGDQSMAKQWWQRAAKLAGDFQQMSVLAVSDMTYWRGAALNRLDQTSLAREVYRDIAAYADRLNQTEPKVDYYATSLPTMLLVHEDLARRNHILASFLRAQATHGLYGPEASRSLLRTVLALDSNHAAASDLLLQAEFAHPVALARKGR